MVEVTLTTGDVIKLRDVKVRARKMTEPRECLYVGVPSIEVAESYQRNYEVFQSLENQLNYFELDITVRMCLYEENMC